MIEGILIGAGVFMAGMVTGRWWPARRRGPKPPKPVQPVCGCGHHFSLHDPETRACSGMVDGSREPVRSEGGKVVKDYWGDVVFSRPKVPCGCRKYTGPEPLPEYYAPELPS